MSPRTAAVLTTSTSEATTIQYAAHSSATPRVTWSSSQKNAARPRVTIAAGPSMSSARQGIAVT
jgi:hypothetical protein